MKLKDHLQGIETLCCFLFKATLYLLDYVKRRSEKLGFFFKKENSGSETHW